jgi:hypothetical protein
MCGKKPEVVQPGREKRLVLTGSSSAPQTGRRSSLFSYIFSSKENV